MQREEKKLARTSSVLREYWRAAIKYRWLFALSLCGILIIQTGRVLAPLFLSKFVTAVSQYQPAQEAALVVIAPLLLYGLFELVAWIGTRVEMWAGVHLAPKAMKDLNHQAFSHLMR